MPCFYSSSAGSTVTAVATATATGQRIVLDAKDDAALDDGGPAVGMNLEMELEEAMGSEATAVAVDPAEDDKRERTCLS